MDGCCLPRVVWVVLISTTWCPFPQSKSVLHGEGYNAFQDGGYLLWRLEMFLPFALFTGLVLKFRPGLLPYFMIVYALMDVTTVLVSLMI